MKKISQEKLTQTTDWIEFSKKFVGDNNYNMPTKNWIKLEFSPFFMGILKNLSLPYSFKFDCDDYSSLYRVLAQICHKKSEGNGEGIAVAEIMYKPNWANGLNHAINAAYTDEGWVFIEPQGGQIIKLTEEEINSIYYVRL
jgi:hypothetical protein